MEGREEEYTSGTQRSNLSRLINYVAVILEGFGGITSFVQFGQRGLGGLL